MNRPPPESLPEILPAREYLDLDTEPLTKKEIAKVIHSSKAVGPDQVPPDDMKTDSEVIRKNTENLV